MRANCACRAAPNPAASLAGRWAAKESVVKAISSGPALNCVVADLNAYISALAAPDVESAWKGAGASLRGIEISSSPSGAPTVVLNGQAKVAAGNARVVEVTGAFPVLRSYPFAFL